MDRFFKAFYKGHKSVYLFRRIVLKSFYHTLAWQPSWPCDQHYDSRFFSLYLKEYVQNVVENGHVVS